MIPYGGLDFFYVLVLLVIPAIILGLKSKSLKGYGSIINILVLFMIFGGSKLESLCLILFYLGELILVKTFSYINSKKKSKWLLRIAIFLSLTPLILVKISPLFTLRKIGFLGISYVSFKCIQILIEIYDGIITKVKIMDFTYFILFFPTISSGPIDRSRRFMNDIDNKGSATKYKENLNEGFWKIFTGIGYKFVISALITNLWLDKIPQKHTFFNTVNYMYAYSLNLFFDFAGYSLIAIGTSYILGVRTPENFDKPFISKDIKEFWNRWHMSLSFWFRDFIYTRFVMFSFRKKLFKNKYTASYIGYFITMGTMGIWHGIEKYYIIYGFYHAFLIIITDYFQRHSSFYKKNKNTRAFSLLSIIITFNLICFGFLIFSGYLFN